MSQHSEEVRKKRLLKGQDWDKHNKTVEKASQAYQEFAESDATAIKQKKPRKRWPIVVTIVLVVLAVAGVAVYWFGFRDSGKMEQESETPATQSAAPESNLAAGEPETFSSSTFFLSFTHLDTWEVDESDPDALTVTSPVTSLKTASGSTTRGRVIMTIRHKTNPLKEFDAGNATATKASELMNYTKPTQAQRASTYLSFVVYAGATAGLDAFYITGDYGYQVGQSVPKVDIANVDPIISVNFEQCIDAACTETNPATISLEQWADPNFSGPIKTLLQSISIN